MNEIICVVCPKGCRLKVEKNSEEKNTQENNVDYNVTGNKCRRGIQYGINEMTAPKRVITSTVKITGGIHKRLPVMTNGAIPKELNFKCMDVINSIEVISPIKSGDIIVSNILDTGIDLVATRNM